MKRGKDTHQVVTTRLEFSLGQRVTVGGVLKYILSIPKPETGGRVRSSHKPKLSAPWPTVSLKWILCQGHHQTGVMLPWR